MSSYSDQVQPALPMRRLDQAHTIPPVRWPHKHDLLGVQVSATTYDEVVETVLAAAERREPNIVSMFSVHAVVTAARDPDLRSEVNRFGLVAPDGQPVRWALNWLHHTRLSERVYGPEAMLRLCAEAAERGVAVYFYGSTSAVLESLQARLRARFPHLRIAGAEAPPFRPLTAAEDAAVVQRINESGAGILFVGLGCPKQDLFAAAHADSIHAVQVCVGAAFDFHAGTLSMAPAWMQRRGLEWLYRLAMEPRRLWRRYLVTNTIFVVRLAGAWIGRGGRSKGARPD